MSLSKLPFLLADAIAMRISATSPNPPSPPKEHLIPDWRERFLKSLAIPCMFLRGFYWSAEFVEMAIIIASQNPTGPISTQILSRLTPHETFEQIQFTPLFFFGVMLSLYGTFLRVQCYGTLGKLFTFELCIRDDHALVTRGPYSVIRHPSYTGLILTIVGAFCTNVTGSWVRECGFLETWIGRSLLFMWLLVAGAVVLSLLLRIPREDEILRRRFGQEWEEWVEKVPYKLVPGVY